MANIKFSVQAKSENSTKIVVEASGFKIIVYTAPHCQDTTFEF